MKKLFIAIFLLANLASCHKALQEEPKIKSIIKYKDEGVNFTSPQNVQEFEKNYLIKENKKLISCKRIVQREAKKEKLSKEEIAARENNCDEIYSGKWLKSDEWKNFKNKAQRGDVFYNINKNSVDGYNGYAITRDGMVMEIYYANKS